MTYKKARNIMRNNVPKKKRKGWSVIAGLHIGRFTLPKFKSSVPDLKEFI